MADAPLCLLQIHAHPDDEASKGAATQARYADEGVRGVLVCCTGGEEGEVLNPAMDRPEIKDNLHAVRMEELAEATKLIGYDKVHLLGYRDSGMPDTEANARPDNFANAPLAEAVDRFASLIRAERPTIVVTYGEDQARYPHPDHLRTHEVTQPAIERAADPTWETEAGPAWQVAKVYYSHGFSRRRLFAMHEWFETNGDESPFKEWVSKIPDDHDDAVTTRINIAPWQYIGRDALAAHRTQVNPDGHWFKIPLEYLQEVHPYEEYQLAPWSPTGLGPVDAAGFEDDLFAGLR